MRLMFSGKSDVGRWPARPGCDSMPSVTGSALGGPPAAEFSVGVGAWPIILQTRGLWSVSIDQLPIVMNGLRP